MATQKNTPRRTREAWQELVRQWEGSQMTAKAWCLQQEVSYDSFIIWRNLLKSTSNPQKATFVELTEPSLVSSGIEIHSKNLRLFLSKNFDTATLLRCLQALEKLSC
jgi:hypothetical protein